MYTILVVDDERSVRLLAERFFQINSFQVETAETAQEGIERFVGQPTGTYRAIFTDVNTGGTISGLDLAKKAHEYDPSVYITVASGYMNPEQQEALSGLQTKGVVKHFCAKNGFLDWRKVIAQIQEGLTASQTPVKVALLNESAGTPPPPQYVKNHQPFDK